VEELSDDNLVPVGEGISYLSKIEEVQVLPKRKVLAFLKDRGVEDAVAAAKLVCRARRHELLVLLLGEPRLLFASPVTKEKLNKHMRFGRGAMGSRSCSLDDLLAASKL
jgi:hypothetical protein